MKLWPRIALLGLVFSLLAATFTASAQTTYTDRFSGSVIATIGKQPVVAATTAPISLAYSQVIDGVTVSDHTNDDTGKAPDRVLVKNQADETQNGIYTVSNTGPWTYTQDFSGNSGVVNGQLIIVAGGNSQTGLWELTTADPICVGNSPSIGPVSGCTPSEITFAQYEIPFASIGLTNGDIFVGNASNMAAEVAMSGDCTIANTGAITCLDSNGSPILTAADTATLTNKTYDTAGTGNVFKINGQQVSSVSGNTNKVATASGSFTSGDCLEINSSGNVVDAGGACTTGGGGGTVTSSTQYQVGAYPSTGTVITGLATLTTDAHGVLNIAAGTITSNDPALDVTQTWNASGTTFNGILENITNSASAAASLLLNLEVGGTPEFSISKAGAVTVGSWAGTIIPIAEGGTGVSLAATGGTSEVLKQVSSGANVTVGQLACSDLSNAATSCATDATDASNLSSGTVPTARLGSGTASSSTVLYGDQTYKAAPSGALVLLDTINASNASQVTFSSTYITSAYNKYVIEFDSVTQASPSTAISLYIQVTAGSLQTSGYLNSAGGVTTAIDVLGTTIGGSSDAVYVQGTVKFASPSASSYTPFISDTAWVFTGGVTTGRTAMGGVWNGTTAITAIKIFLSSGNITGNFHLYGVQGN